MSSSSLAHQSAGLLHDKGVGKHAIEEIRLATRVMIDLAKPDKVNVGALGNIVTQLHIHVVGRFRSDPAWPGPVWGFEARKPYPHHARAQLAGHIRVEGHQRRRSVRRADVPADGHRPVHDRRERGGANREGG